jgi:uncharacterized protein
VQDVQKKAQEARERAAEFGVDPAKIAVLGLSAAASSGSPGLRMKTRCRTPIFHEPLFFAYNRGLMVPRSDKIERIHSLLASHPVVALLGPRQSGKTTLARGYMAAYGLGDATSPNYFDLEDPAALARLETPKLALESLTGLIVIDEVQRAPDLFSLLRVLVDRDDSPCRFLVLGSASRDLIRQSSETLAGRIAYLEVPPLDLAEVGTDETARLWLRGGFPRSFLAPTEPASIEWRRQFITTFLERDIPALGLTVPPQQLRRFWMMLAHFHGQTFNASEIGRSLQVSDTTVARYLDILAGTFMVRTLRPWFENIGKRQVKRPKIFIRDSGLLHALMGIASRDDLLVHARLGASWEGFALEQVMTVLGLDADAAHCWGVHQQCDLDLFVIHHGRRIGFEIKYTEAPAVSSSMRAACEALSLDRLVIVSPGRMMYPLGDRIEACGIERLGELPL